MSGRRAHVPLLPSPSARLLPRVQYGERRGKLVISAHGTNADHLTSSLAGGAAVPTGEMPAPAPPAPVANLAAGPRACFVICLLLMGRFQCRRHGVNSHSRSWAYPCWDGWHCGSPLMPVPGASPRRGNWHGQDAWANRANPPPFGRCEVFELLPRSGLASPLSFGPFAGFGATLLTARLSARSPE